METKPPTIPSTDSPTGVERRRAPHRIYMVFIVIMVGMILNTILWLTGNATEYEYLPLTFAVAGALLLIHLVTDRRKSRNALQVPSKEPLLK